MGASDDKSALFERFANGRDVFCPFCDHSLRNTKTRRCSECGSVLELIVAKEGNPNPRGWVSGVIGFAMGTGVVLGVLSTIAFLIWIGDMVVHPVVTLIVVASLVYCITGMCFLRAWIRGRSTHLHGGWEKLAVFHTGRTRGYFQWRNFAFGWMPVLGAVGMIIVSLLF